MRRRDFIAGVGSAALSAQAFARIGSKNQARRFIEIRIYHFASREKQNSFEQFAAITALPAFNRAGARPIGVFKLLANDNPDLKIAADSTDLYVLIPHDSASALAQFPDRLASDKAFLQEGGAILMAAKSDPAYTRYESSLMLEFEGFPSLQVPTSAASRVLQLRIYESYNDDKARKKLKMFNQGGELGIFRRTGMTGVFFGQTLIGSKLPSLTYMLSFENDVAQKKAWDTFRNDPEWKRLSKEEEYKDVVSNITNLILRPASGSQI